MTTHIQEDFLFVRPHDTKKSREWRKVLETFRMRGFLYVLRHLSFMHAWGARKSRRDTHLASEDEERASYVCTGIVCFFFRCFFCI